MGRVPEPFWMRSRAVRLLLDFSAVLRRVQSAAPQVDGAESKFLRDGRVLDRAVPFLGRRESDFVDDDGMGVMPQLPPPDILPRHLLHMRRLRLPADAVKVEVEDMLGEVNVPVYKQLLLRTFRIEPDVALKAVRPALVVARRGVWPA